ncbi:MAG: pyridoxamine 5'-phosphate oxidase family protein [Lachnospiraceae bacterium]|nr:pyridoxamine 5'-phosphate oxidase family protein [Lachnospiraceae bacterium]
MFRKIRRVKNEIGIEDAKLLLKEGKRAAFSVIGDEGYPYTVPINFYYDEAENRIYFHSAKQGHKIDSIKANDKVCLAVWNEGYKDEGDWAYRVSSCIVFGRARLISDPAITVEKVRTFARKYYPTFEEVEEEIERDIKGVQLVAIDIEHISGKKIHEK